MPHLAGACPIVSILLVIKTWPSSDPVFIKLIAQSSDWNDASLMKLQIPSNHIKSELSKIQPGCTRILLLMTASSTIHACLLLITGVLLWQVVSIKEDLEQGVLTPTLKPGRDGLLQLLHDKGIRYIPFSGWEKIDLKERKDGSLRNKPREKITSWDDLLNVANE